MLSERYFAPASFLPEDHEADNPGSLAEHVRNRVETRTGMRLQGPIRLLTQLRYFGHYFSPLNLYYCFDSADDTIDAIVAEVSNTPWDERHHYVLWEGNRTPPDVDLCFTHNKEFHVSPFMEMDLQYLWKRSIPGSNLNVSLTNSKADTPLFHAAMCLQRHPMTRRRFNRFLIR